MNSLHESGCAMGVGTLAAPERLLLWAMRAWSAYHSDLTAVWWSLDRAFTQEGIHSALPSFHHVMSALFAGLKRWPDIRCVQCPRLGADEARLLSVFARLQHDNEVGARHALQGWVVRSAARVMCERAVECVGIASSAGLRFTFSQSSEGLQEAASTCARFQGPKPAANADLPVH